MAAQDAAHADLAELRTVVARAREQALQVSMAAKRARAGLQEEAARLREQREEAERGLREDVRRGEVDPDRRELAEQLDRGEVTWRDVLTGAAGAELRAEVGAQVEATVEELRATDPSFRDEHDATLRQAAESMRDLR